MADIARTRGMTILVDAEVYVISTGHIEQSYVHDGRIHLESAVLSIIPKHSYVNKHTGNQTIFCLVKGDIQIRL